MRNNLVRLLMLAAMTGAMLSVASSVRAADDYAMKSGKMAEISLSSKTRVGILTLPAGTYRIQHQVKGSDHFIDFTGLARTDHSNPGILTGHSGKAECRFEPLPDKVKRTAVGTTEENGVRRVTRIEIAGESVAHLF